MAILTDLRDPRIEDVTVTHVEVSPDMRQAKVHVSVMGDEAQQKLCLHGLRSSAGFLQSKIAERIDTRYTPRLRFVLDDGREEIAGHQPDAAASCCRIRTRSPETDCRTTTADEERSPRHRGSLAARP